MDKYFVWIIPLEPHAVSKKHGISATYIIPKGMMNENEALLSQSNIWLITRGKQDQLVAYIKPKQIDRFKEGFQEGDYLLFTQVSSSFRISSINGQSKAFCLGEFKNYSLGINQITNELNHYLYSLVQSKVEVKLVQPNKEAFAKIDFENLPKSKRGVAKLALTTVLQNFNLEQVWGSGIGLKLSPFANFAHKLLEGKSNATLANECAALLRNFEPLNVIFNIDGYDNALKKQIDPTVVDIDFIEIDPETIYAREFVTSGDTLIDLEAALAKTEAAEKLHQEMLRDISVYLKSRGVIPYETSSIDLMIQHKGEIDIYEIKSTADNNLMAQCAKGAFQLSFYVEALIQEYPNLKYALIIHKTKNEFSEQTCLQALVRLGIPCLIYDPSRQWPHRIQGFKGFESSIFT